MLRKHGVKFKIVSPDAATRERLDGKPSPPQKLGMRCQLVMLAGIPEGMRTVLFLSVYHASGENLALRLLIAQRGARNRAGQTALALGRSLKNVMNKDRRKSQ